MKSITIVGAGYVGLVSAACFAHKGNKVVVVEKDSKKRDLLAQGIPHFYEPGLAELVKQGVLSGNLIFTSEMAEALKHNPKMIFSCVGTPSLPDGSVDMSYVKNVAAEIGRNLTGYALVINKSTVPVGTVKKVKSIISNELATREVNINFEVASNPEFLKEGTAVDDSMYPDRVVVGVGSDNAEKLLYDLYRPFLKGDDQFMVMNCESSELTKYASNSMLATRISFMNQLALLADEVGADIKQVKKGMSYDKRIGKEFLNAGIGYGGSCFPKDVKALVNMGKQYFSPMTIVQEVDAVNNRQRQWFIDSIVEHYGETINNKIVAILGLAFKPDTDDIRYAPSIDLITQLLAKGVKIKVYDPVANENIKAIFSNGIEYFDSYKDAMAQVDFAVVLTEWKDIRSISTKEWLTLKDKTLFDARNCFEPNVMIANGINYFCVGRNSGTKEVELDVHVSRENGVYR